MTHATVRSALLFVAFGLVVSPPSEAQSSLAEVRVAATSLRTLVVRPDGIVVGQGDKGDNRYNALGRSSSVGRPIACYLCRA